jgi:hypothetical protein
MGKTLVLYTKFDEAVQSQKFIQLNSNTSKINEDIDSSESHIVSRKYNLYNDKGEVVGYIHNHNNVHVFDNKISRHATYTLVLDEVGTLTGSGHKENLFTPYTNKLEYIKQFTSKTGEFEFKEVNLIVEVLSDNTRKYILGW